MESVAELASNLPMYLAPTGMRCQAVQGLLISSAPTWDTMRPLSVCAAKSLQALDFSEYCERIAFVV